MKKMSPDISCHKEKQDKNYNLFKFINQNLTDHQDWESIVLFYAALHCVHYFLAVPPLSIHPKSHTRTNKLISRHLPRFSANYLVAYQVSRWARYDKLEITDEIRDNCTLCFNEVKHLIPTNTTV